MRPLAVILLLLILGLHRSQALLKRDIQRRQNGPSSTLITPGPNTRMVADKPFLITWTSAAPRISLVLRKGTSNNLATVEEIASGIFNSGSFIWTPPVNLQGGDDYSVEIVEDYGSYQTRLLSTDFSIESASDADPSVPVSSPITTETKSGDSRPTAPGTTAEALPSTTTQRDPLSRSSLAIPSSNSDTQMSPSAPGPTSSEVSSEKPPDTIPGEGGNQSQEAGQGDGKGSNPDSKRLGILIGAIVGPVVFTVVLLLLVFRRSQRLKAGRTEHQKPNPGTSTNCDPPYELDGTTTGRSLFSSLVGKFRDGSIAAHHSREILPELGEIHRVELDGESSHPAKVLERQSVPDGNTGTLMNEQHTEAVRDAGPDKDLLQVQLQDDALGSGVEPLANSTEPGNERELENVYQSELSSASPGLDGVGDVNELVARQKRIKREKKHLQRLMEIEREEEELRRALPRTN